MDRSILDQLSFVPSAAASIGVELEIQILDRETGEIAPGAIPILRQCKEQALEGVTAEFMQSMIEIKTGVCADVAEVRAQLYPLARTVRNIATSLGYELALCGTHPFARSSHNAVFPGERYERIRDRLGWVASHDLIFGLHVHVGVPNGDMAIALINCLVQYLPHLLALSANSPFWQGVDTGLASFRAAFYGLIPHSGVPPYFSKWKDFRNYLQVMLGSKAIGSLKDVYWDIRPRPDYGTIELRIFDAPPSLADVLGLVALTRSLVIATGRLLAERPQLRRGDIRKQWMALENKWSAIRHGLEGTYIRTPSGKRRSLAHDAGELIERLLPVARESGDDRFLKMLQPLDGMESGPARQRRLYRESGSWTALIDDMTRRLSRELSQQEACRPSMGGCGAASSVLAHERGAAAADPGRGG
jgi:carboxylate-amine ligase